MLAKLGLVFLALTISVAPWQEQVKKIDQQIAVLKDLQEKVQARAERNINNAMRWQFQRENYLDARRAWDQVALDRQKIKEIQDEIDQLNLQKQQIIDKHASKTSP